MNFGFLKTYTVRILAGFLFVTILAVGTLPDRANANGACPLCATEVTQIINLIEDTVGNIITGITASDETAEWVKDYILDPVAWTTKDVVLNQIITHVVETASTGLNGQSVFVKNIGDHYLNVAANEARDFADAIGNDPDISCYGPLFSAGLQNRLANAGAANDQAAFNRSYGCPLNSVAGAFASNFLSGDFTTGGWAAWNTSMVRGANPMAFMTRADLQFANAQANKQDQTKQQLQWGNGIISIPDPLDPNNSISVPATVINSQLADALNAQNIDLANADEIGEMVAGVLSTVVAQSLQKNSFFPSK